MTLTEIYDEDTNACRSTKSVECNLGDMMQNSMDNVLTQIDDQPHTPDSSAASDSSANLPRIVYKFPQSDHSDFSFPDGVQYFCVPGDNFEKGERTARTSTFLMTTGNGTRIYGAFLDRAVVTDTNKETQQRHTHHHIMCLLSHHPHFTLFISLLLWIDDATRGSLPNGDDLWKSLDILLHSFVEKGSLLPRVGHELIYELCCSSLSAPKTSTRWNIYYQIPRGKLPFIDDFCFHVLFHCLSLKNITQLVSCLALEKRVLLHSADISVLTPACEALKALLFPFTWEHVYIPFLPTSLIDYVNAPMPFLIGTHTGSLLTMSTCCSDAIAQCVIVHLDKDQVIAPMRWASQLQAEDTSNATELQYFPEHVFDVAMSIIRLQPEIPYPKKRHDFSKATTSAGKRRKLIELHKRRSSVNAPKTGGLQDVPLNSAMELKRCIFYEDKLGITLAAYGGPLTAPAIVKDLPKVENDVPGPVESSGQIKIGSLLVAINDRCVLGWKFNRAIALIRTLERPFVLQFWTPVDQLSESKSQKKLVARDESEVSMIASSSPCDRANRILPWTDTIRSSFVFLFTSLLENFESFIRVETKNLHCGIATEEESTDVPSKPSSLSSVHFDFENFIASSLPSTQEFLREFIRKQAFVELVNDFALERVAKKSGSFERVTLFKQFLHLYHEAETPLAAIPLLAERQYEYTTATRESLALKLH